LVSAKYGYLLDAIGRNKFSPSIVETNKKRGLSKYLLFYFAAKLDIRFKVL
jgi:hypothetical protein